MIPAVKAFVESIDIEANLMRVHLIEGMRTDES
jgi:ribosomal 30S subunit maturation factor RimM